MCPACEGDLMDYRLMVRVVDVQGSRSLPLSVGTTCHTLARGVLPLRDAALQLTKAGKRWVCCVLCVVWCVVLLCVCV
jgi:hypothetical protein